MYKLVLFLRKKRNKCIVFLNKDKERRKLYICFCCYKVLLRFQVQEEKYLTIHNSVATEKYRSWKLPLIFSIKMLSSLLTIVMGQTIQKHICKANRELLFRVVLFQNHRLIKRNTSIIIWKAKGCARHSCHI